VIGGGFCKGGPKSRPTKPSSVDFVTPSPGISRGVENLCSRCLGTVRIARQLEGPVIEAKTRYLPCR